MPEAAQEVSVRPASELDIGDIVRIDERIGGAYRPEVWERRLGYYIRRDPDSSVVAVAPDGRVVGFMLGEVRSGEFGLEQPTGWVEVLGVDPDFRGHGAGRRMADAMIAHFKGRGAVEVRTLVDEQALGDVAGFFRSLGFAPATLKPFVLQL